MNRRRILQISTLFGVLVSLYLVRQHVIFEMTGRADSGLCAVARIFDCTAVERSAFSSIYGVPTAAVGFLYFLGFFLYTIRAGSGAAAKARPEVAEGRFWAVASLVSLGGLFASLILGTLSAVVIRGFCLGCSVVYLVTLVNAVTAARAGFTEYLAACFLAPKELAAVFVETFGDEPLPGADTARKFILTFLFVVAPLSMWLPYYYATRNVAQNAVLKYEASPLVDLVPGDPALTIGPPDAPLQIVMFTDFDCPSCRLYAPYLKAVLAEFKQYYRLTYKHYPLGRCNPVMNDQPKVHDNACRLAEMAQALGAMSRFTTIGEELYQLQGQKELYPSLKGIAEFHNFVYLDWVREAENPATREKVNADIAEGNKLGITSVPALFLNGKYVPTLKPELLEQVLIHEFRKTHSETVQMTATPAPAAP